MDFDLMPCVQDDNKLKIYNKVRKKNLMSQLHI